MNLIEELNFVIQKLPITIAELAKLLDVQVNDVHAWKSGTAIMPLNCLNRFNTLLDITKRFTDAGIVHGMPLLRVQIPQTQVTVLDLLVQNRVSQQAIDDLIVVGLQIKQEYEQACSGAQPKPNENWSATMSVPKTTE